MKTLTSATPFQLRVSRGGTAPPVGASAYVTPYIHEWIEAQLRRGLIGIHICCLFIQIKVCIIIALTLQEGTLFLSICNVSLCWS